MFKKRKKNNNLIAFLGSEKYALSSQEDKAFYLDSISKKIDEMPNDTVTKNLAFKISSEYYYLKDNKKSFNLSKKAYNISQKLSDSIGMGRALYYMGDCYEFTKKDSAYYYYKESEKFFRLLDNKGKLAKVYFNKSYLLFYEGNYAESELEVIKALQNLSNSANYKLKYSCYSLQGSIHNELEEYDKALYYFRLAEEAYYDLRADYKNDIESIYDYYVLNVINLCNIYDKKGEYKKSISELSKIKTKELKVNWPNLYNLVIGNLAYSKMKNGDLNEANKLFEEALFLNTNDKNDKGYLYKILYYGEFRLILKDSLKAKEYFDEALMLSKRFNSGNEILKSLNFLSKIDLSNSAYYKNEYIKVSDSIIRQQRASSNKFARIEYETNKLESANEQLIKRNFNLLLSGSFLIIIFLIILGIRHRKAQKREIEFLELRKAADNELYELVKDNQIQLVKIKENVQNRIAKELHDGVMNDIYSVRLNLGFLNSSDDEAMKEKRLLHITELQKIEREIRDLSHDLNHETDFDQIDYRYLLNKLIETIDEISPTIYSCIIEPLIKWDNYSSVIKINIYRILQEFCSNVNKYAKAENCIIELTTTKNSLIVSVIDDGIGFDTSKITDGIGMKNIKQRINTIKGKIEIKSSQGKGTKVFIEIPKIKKKK
ncbi:ATP-binding protein [uncultured Flavobacterium sp.]|uniref:tetratricopeptide repeat-containing sensor histidine kinase n=1 Tax=uncultured Flavobacterium sp. TaxID=165435 RepID=UPI0030EDC693